MVVYGSTTPVLGVSEDIDRITYSTYVIIHSSILVTKKSTDGDLRIDTVKSLHQMSKKKRKSVIFLA